MVKSHKPIKETNNKCDEYLARLVGEFSTDGSEAIQWDLVSTQMNKAGYKLSELQCRNR